MANIKDALFEVHELEELALRELEINRVHPLAKLLTTISYMILVVSYHKYDIWGLLPLFIYPMVLMKLSEISLKVCFRKIRGILPLILFIGLFNPFLDREVLFMAGKIPITGGILSFLTLFLKGVYCLVASFLLIATTGIEGVCYSLRILKLPGILVNQFLLTYRYITVLMKEANAVYQAYSLRAPGEKGVKYKIWGSLLGQLFLRSIDRAGNLYESMLLRGFEGEYYLTGKPKAESKDYAYFLLWAGIFLILRVGIRYFIK